MPRSGNVETQVVLQRKISTRSIYNLSRDYYEKTRWTTKLVPKVPKMHSTCRYDRTLLIVISGCPE